MKKSLLLSLLIISSYFYAQITLGGTGTGTGTGTGPLPISASYEFTYSQQIFTKQEINTNAAGYITGLVFYMNDDTLLDNSSDWDVYLGHTSKTSFNSNSDWIPISELTHTFEGLVMNDNGIVKVNFDVPFLYNNTDHLVIAVRDDSEDYNSADEHFKQYNATANSAMFLRQGYSIWNLSDPGDGYRVNYKSMVTIEGLSQTLATSESNKTENLVRLYPNPVKDVLHLDRSDLIKTVVISDHLGRLIKTIKKPSSSVDIMDLREGSFFISLEMKDGSRQFLRFIKN